MHSSSRVRQVVGERAENDVQHAHLQDDLRDRKQHGVDEVPLLALEFLGIGGEIRLKAAHFFDVRLAPAQEPALAEEPDDGVCQRVQHRRAEQQRDRDDPEPVDRDADDDDRNQLRALRLQLRIHIEERRDRAEHEGKLVGEEFDEQHRRRVARIDLAAQQIRHLHRLPAGRARSDVGIVKADEADLEGCPEADALALTPEQHAADLPLHDEEHAGH